MTYTIAQYLNVRQAFHPSFSSDGARLAFLTNITGDPQVWQIALDDRAAMLWPDQLTFETDRVLGAWFSPAPSDARLIFARDAGGNENAQLFLLSADGVVTPLTAGYEKALHTFGAWSADGRRILFSANRRDPALFDLYLQPLDGEAQMIWQNDAPGFLFKMAFSPDEQCVAVVRLQGSFDQAIVEIDLATGLARQINPSTDKARYEALAYTPDGKSLLVNTDFGSDFMHLAQIDRGTLQIETVVAQEQDLEWMTLSPDGRLIAYVANVDGATTLHLLERSNGATRTAPALGAAPGVVAFWDYLLCFSADSSRLAFSFTSATQTSDVYLWDIQANRVQAVTRCAHGGIPLDQFGAPQIVHYPTFDGRSIPAWFYKPAASGGRRLPVIVFVHGGPESQFQPYFHFFIQYFVQHGYAVFAPNVRGSTGYGKAYSHLDDIEQRMDSVADLAHAALWLKQQPDLDGDRLVVYGGSYGGFMVLSALTTYPELWAAGVDIVGISNFVTFLENTSAYRRGTREAEYGTLSRDREFLESISPNRHLDRLRAPLLVVHGANDPRVPLSEAQQIVAALEARGVPTQLLVFDDEGHGIIKLKNKLVMYPIVVEFLDRYLKR
jgi:dipeptidyl aminopeptidase/acylaminoacyl peptidase